MKSLRWAVWGATLAVAAMVAGACGDQSEEERREQRAKFVRDADAACDTVIDQLATRPQPRSYGALAERMSRDSETLERAGDDLHELREKLGDAASMEIVTFDERLDALPAAARRIGDDAARGDAAGTRSSAEGLRRAYDALYLAAGEAKLRRCGRGGNKAADVALFTVYRDEYFTVNADVNLRLRGLHDPETPAALRRYMRRSIPVVVNYRQRLGRLAPPQVLHERHRLLLRHTSRALRTARRLLTVLNGGQLGAGTQAVALRLLRQADRLNATDRAIRRVLGAPGRREPSPGRSETQAA